MIQFFLSGYSKFQKCAFQNAFLQIGCQIDKIIAVAAHTNDQITMVFGMPFRILQILRRNNRHGKLLAAAYKIGSCQRSKSLSSLFIREQTFVKLGSVRDCKADRRSYTQDPFQDSRQ